MNLDKACTRYLWRDGNSEETMYDLGFFLQETWITTTRGQTSEYSSYLYVLPHLGAKANFQFLLGLLNREQYQLWILSYCNWIVSARFSLVVPRQRPDRSWGKRLGILTFFFYPEKFISFRLLKKSTRNQMVNLKAGKYLVMNLYYPDLISSGDSENTPPFLNFW